MRGLGQKRNTRDKAICLVRRWTLGAAEGDGAREFGREKGGGVEEGGLALCVRTKSFF